MEEMPCAIALKSTNGRQKHHIHAGLHASRMLRAGAEKCWRAEYTRGGGRGGGARKKQHFGASYVAEGLCMYYILHGGGKMAVIWLRGLLCCACEL
jgi:hypothetical protein